MLVVADADEIDVALAVDLAAGQKEHVDAALPGAVEQFARAVGEEGVRRGCRAARRKACRRPLAREQRRGRRNRRSGADRDMTHVADQPADDVGEQFLVAEMFQAARRSCT